MDCPFFSADSKKNYLPFYKNIKDEFFGLINDQEETFGPFRCVAEAYEVNKNVLVKNPILYPLNMSLSHAYSISRDRDAMHKAIDAGARFNLDCFGCSPLSYAIMQKDLRMIDAIIGWINTMDISTKNYVLSTYVNCIDLF